MKVPMDPLPPSQKSSLDPPGVYINSLQSPSQKVCGSMGSINIPNPVGGSDSDKFMSVWRGLTKERHLSPEAGDASSQMQTLQGSRQLGKGPGRSRTLGSCLQKPDKHVGGHR